VEVGEGMNLLVRLELEYLIYIILDVSRTRVRNYIIR
jgi:hypothetical protein